MKSTHVIVAASVSALLLGVLACSSTDSGVPRASQGENQRASERVGSLGLQLQPVNGITLNSLYYNVSCCTPIDVARQGLLSEGYLPTPGVGSNLSFGLPLPVGTGYSIYLTALSAELGDDVTCFGSYGPFAVTANTSTVLNLTLTCVDTTNGTVVAGVDVKTDACPRLVVDYALVEPSAVGVGSSAAVHSAAHDLDNPAEVISYSWSVVDPAKAGVGQFVPANARDSSFACTSSGDAVRIKVSAKNHQCSKSLETVVSCVADLGGGCGNGFVGAGETCDPGVGPSHPADPSCPADCTKVCGDGNAEGDEQCDPLPLNPAACLPPGTANACHFRPQVCGDGFVTGTELCDTAGNVGANGQPLPGGLVCPADCRSLNSPCGDHVVGAGEECDDGGLSRLCSNTCEVIATPACVACEQAGDCFAASDNCLGPSSTPYTPAQQKMCTDVMQCVQDSNCLDGSGTLGSCYCGTLNTTASCAAAPFDLTQPGAPNGPCAQVMQHGSPSSTSNSSILAGLTSISRPGGVAGGRLNCQKSQCASECGLQ